MGQPLCWANVCFSLFLIDSTTRVGGIIICTLVSYLNRGVLHLDIGRNLPDEVRLRGEGGGLAL